ncbi:MAG TPA: tryptophan 2,3-dioxygenase family protein [Phnomibacter sp.]|nr:tryptophan 2,3-dioxygenase family protein [Phnomibacter sp.]
MLPSPQYYADYLELDKILDAQHPVSFQPPYTPAHDEMLFIVIHQAYELWFKQILHEVASVIGIMQQPAINDNSPQLQTAVHRIDRVNTIMRVLVHQMDIMETMTPMDFLDFRDLLRPASGFQSWQFKVLEARLGLRFDDRHGQAYYTSMLKPEYTLLVKEAEQMPNLLALMNAWLERMPFFNDHELWTDFIPSSANVDGDIHPFWHEYRHLLQKSLADVENTNLLYFEKVTGFSHDPTERQLSPAACRAALFIMLYRGYPMLQQPFQLINSVLELDEQLSTWRYRHMNMVHRMIGHRIGTGGSTGKDYLKGAADKHYIFREFAALTSFLIERRHLPTLGAKMAARLGFAG